MQTPLHLQDAPDTTTPATRDGSTPASPAATASLEMHGTAARTVDQVITRSGARLFVKDWKASNALRLNEAGAALFVHGWAVHSDFWQYQMSHLSGRGVRCVAYDRRGHGRSSDTEARYDIDSLADDLACVIEQLGLTEITLIGHSMGCGEIARYISRHGSSRVAGVVFIAPSLPFVRKTHDNPDGIDGAALDATLEAIMSDLPTYLTEAARHFFCPNTQAAMRNWAVDMCYMASLRALIGCEITNSDTDFRSDLTQLNRPTLIIHGDKDEMAPLPSTARRVAALIPACRLHIVEGGSHGLPLANIATVNQLLLRLLTDRTSATPSGLPAIKA